MKASFCQRRMLSIVVKGKSPVHHPYSNLLATAILRTSVEGVDIHPAFYQSKDFLPQVLPSMIIATNKSTQPGKTRKLPHKLDVAGFLGKIRHPRPMPFDIVSKSGQGVEQPIRRITQLKPKPGKKQPTPGTRSPNQSLRPGKGKRTKPYPLPRRKEKSGALCSPAFQTCVFAHRRIKRKSMPQQTGTPQQLMPHAKKQAPPT